MWKSKSKSEKKDERKLKMIENEKEQKSKSMIEKERESDKESGGEPKKKTNHQNLLKVCGKKVHTLIHRSVYTI